MTKKSYWFTHMCKSEFLRNDIWAGVTSEVNSAVSKDTTTGQERDKRMHCKSQGREVKPFEIPTSLLSSPLQLSSSCTHFESPWC